MIVDVHNHAWLCAEHMSEAFIQETRTVSRSKPVELRVEFDDFLSAMKPVDKAIVFGIKGRHVGVYVPNEYIADFVSRAPDKLIGWMALDPNDADFMEDFERSHRELGLRGIKLAPIFSNFNPTDRSLDDLYGRAQKLGLPILFHTGMVSNRFGPLKWSHPLLFDEVACRFPDLKIILAHLSHPWEAECVAVIRKHPNVYADLSGLSYRPWRFYNTMMVVGEYNVQHKVLFASDYPWTTPGESIDALQKVNQVAAPGMPQVSLEITDEIIHRDSLKLLYDE